jgi:hypothetical protein
MHMSIMSRQFLEEGDFVAHFVSDTQNIVNFVREFSVLSSAPTSLIAVQIFIYIEVGKYGIALSIIIIVSLALLLFLSYKVARSGLKKAEQYKNRVTFNL